MTLECDGPGVTIFIREFWGFIGYGLRMQWFWSAIPVRTTEGHRLHVLSGAQANLVLNHVKRLSRKIVLDPVDYDA
jgi:hypothetical protein